MTSNSHTCTAADIHLVTWPGTQSDTTWLTGAYCRECKRSVTIDPPTKCTPFDEAEMAELFNKWAPSPPPA